MASERVFVKQKEQCLSKVDLSRKGSVDAPIQHLVELLNSHPQYFTTSSCSGRTILFEDNPKIETKKKGCLWLYTTHGQCHLDNLVLGLKQSAGDAYFKFEPFVLHVQCCHLQDAQNLHACAVASGYRNSGITVGNKGKIITAVRSTHSLEVPVSIQGETIVSSEYVKHLCKLANEKMNENLEKIERFHTNLKSMLEQKNENIVPKSKPKRNLQKPARSPKDTSSETVTDQSPNTLCVNTEGMNLLFEDT